MKYLGALCIGMAFVALTARFSALEIEPSETLRPVPHAILRKRATDEAEEIIRACAAQEAW